MEPLTIEQIITQVNTKAKRVRKCKEVPEDIVKHILLYRAADLSYRKIKDALELSHPEYEATVYTINKVIDDNLTDEQRVAKQAKQAERKAARELKLSDASTSSDELDLDADNILISEASDE